MSANTIYNANKLNAIERYGHVSVLHADRYLVIFGGHNLNDENTNQDNLDCIWVFDTLLEEWRKFYTKGEFYPHRVSGAYGIVDSRGSLYVFGGFCNNRHTNSMFKLNLKTFEWKYCKPGKNKLPSPRDKYSGWFSEKDERIYYFGGFGEPIDDIFLNDCGDFNVDEQFNFSEDQPQLGWNNQLVYFDINTQTWHNPCYNRAGSKPLPRAAHCCVYMSNNNSVILFGGRVVNSRTNDLYKLDLDKFQWSDNLNSQTNKNPTGRSWMVMVKLNENELLMYGGFIGGYDALGDTWILNVKDLIWTEIILKNIENRLWHTAAVVNRNKQVYVFGGCSKSFIENKPELPKHLLKLIIFPELLIDKCLNFICLNFHLFKNEIIHGKSIPRDLKEIIKLKCYCEDDKENLF